MTKRIYENEIYEADDAERTYVWNDGKRLRVFANENALRDAIDFERGNVGVFGEPAGQGNDPHA